MRIRCDSCGASFNDADRTTLCPHGWLMPAEDMARKQEALDLLEHTIRFAHQPDGPDHRVQSVGATGMVTLRGMAGEFSPHLFVKVAAHG